MKIGRKDRHVSVYIFVHIFIVLDSLELAFRKTLLSPKHPSFILQGNQKLGVCDGRNLLLGRKIGPSPGTAGSCFGCAVYHALTYMGTHNQVLYSMLKLTFLLISLYFLFFGQCLKQFLCK